MEPRQVRGVLTASDLYNFYNCYLRCGVCKRVSFIKPRQFAILAEEALLLQVSNRGPSVLKLQNRVNAGVDEGRGAIVLSPQRSVKNPDGFKGIKLSLPLNWTCSDPIKSEAVSQRARCLLDRL
ncbi:hypothetical protein AVEN_86562-1 [Araneus ventricosus]|uniref:Uncharacterized protein n=1 Tax=Araneus ventricosus TaxID=182803 RepID=A0A4Y2SSP5_ARAVE|nr:hypothetical protein AVEN_86562-1 [Araneus ventricosus]